jgi:hypothetical protein
MAMFEWFKSLFFQKKSLEPRMIEHRRMKVYLSSEMIEMFEKKKIDYELGFRQAVDDVLDSDEDDEDGNNPYR